MPEETRDKGTQMSDMKPDVSTTEKCIQHHIDQGLTRADAEKECAAQDTPPQSKAVAGTDWELTVTDSSKEAIQFTDPPNWLTPEAEERFSKSVAERVWDGIRARLGVKDSDEQTAFKVQGNHFFTVLSNNFKDRDGEMFPESAIDAYVARVDMGVTPLPELQVWHAGKSTAIGAADWVARHGHFVMAGGQFYGGDAAQAAKAYYTRNAKNTGISHGFTYPAAQFDGKVYKAFNTFEISLLPRGTEANWYTSLEGVKAMALDDKKVKYLKDVFGEEHATRILADWDARGKALEDLNVEFKDFVQPDAEPAADKQADSEGSKATAQILSDLMENSSVPVTAALEAVKAVKAQDAKLAGMQQRLDQLEQRIKSSLDNPPRASQSAETVVETSHLSPELQKSIQDQNTVRDGFWGTNVVKTP